MRDGGGEGGCKTVEGGGGEDSWPEEVEDGDEGTSTGG